MESSPGNRYNRALHGAAGARGPAGRRGSSAGYATIDASGAVGQIHIAAAGLGPNDGFTSYKALVGDPPRTRWGDYGAAVTDGNSIWIASEYIAQTCSFTEYYLNPPNLAGFGSCGATRTSLANWATRLNKINP